MKYDIFISYRRKGGYDTAKHLNDLLVKDGYSVSFDIDTLRSGDFDIQLLERIDQCKDFVLIVDEHCFDRTLDSKFDPQKDWLRCELAYALKQNKNIIPVFLSGVKDFPEGLPNDVKDVIKKNGPEYNRYYFNDFYDTLKKRFLKSSPRRRIWYLLLFISIVAIIAIFYPEPDKNNQEKQIDRFPSLFDMAYGDRERTSIEEYCIKEFNTDPELMFIVSLLQNGHNLDYDSTILWYKECDYYIKEYYNSHINFAARPEIKEKRILDEIDSLIVNKFEGTTSDMTTAMNIEADIINYRSVSLYVRCLNAYDESDDMRKNWELEMKSWIDFRKSYSKYVYNLGSFEYFGGTIASNIGSANICSLNSLRCDYLENMLSHNYNMNTISHEKFDVKTNFTSKVKQTLFDKFNFNKEFEGDGYTELYQNMVSQIDECEPFLQRLLDAEFKIGEMTEFDERYIYSCSNNFIYNLIKAGIPSE